MLKNILHNKVALLGVTVALMICSISVSFIYENNLTDGLSISASIILGLVIICLTLILLLELIRSICNP